MTFKRLIAVGFISVGLLVPSISSASNFEDAVASTSALVPAAKPFSSRTAYVKTTPYI